MGTEIPIAKLTELRKLKVLALLAIAKTAADGAKEEEEESAQRVSDAVFRALDCPELSLEDALSICDALRETALAFCAKTC